MSIEKTPIIVFVVSSTGDGDPPDNSSTFFRDMKKAPSDRLKGIQYTVLGLGDSNYTSFMHVPREFHRKCREMGATMFYEYKEADEVDGLDDITEAWVDGIWDVLKKATKGVWLNLLRSMSELCEGSLDISVLSIYRLPVMNPLAQSSQRYLQYKSCLQLLQQLLMAMLKFLALWMIYT